jgi:hypothetical protein
MFHEWLDVDVLDLQIELWYKYFCIFKVCQCFGSFFQKLGIFFTQSFDHNVSEA